MEITELRRNMEKTTWEQAEEFAVEVIREARKKQNSGSALGW